MEGFGYTGLPARVVFGSATLAQVRAEVERLAITRALVKPALIAQLEPHDQPGWHRLTYHFALKGLP